MKNKCFWLAAIACGVLTPPQQPAADRATAGIGKHPAFRSTAPMSVSFQYAGKSRPGRADDIKHAVDASAALLKAQPGFERARLLINRATLQVQWLVSWQSYEAGAAFNAGAHRQVAAQLLPLMESQGTLVASVLEADVAAAGA